MNASKYTGKKHGENLTKILKTYDSLKRKIMKVEGDIRFMK